MAISASSSVYKELCRSAEEILLSFSSYRELQTRSTLLERSLGRGDILFSKMREIQMSWGQRNIYLSGEDRKYCNRFLAEIQRLYAFMQTDITPEGWKQIYSHLESLPSELVSSRVSNSAQPPVKVEKKKEKKEERLETRVDIVKVRAGRTDLRPELQELPSSKIGWLPELQAKDS